ncbi:MAG: hypothetical protein MJ090_05265 [Clostridia bacterium]|nr:hypothetical protein [Clostridia bacterium]
MINNKYKKYEKIFLFAFMLLPTIAITLNLDNDFWFLLNQGKYVVNYGFPNFEPFTIHNGFEFIIQQWLFDLIIYFLYMQFGKIGVLILVFSMSILTAFLIYKLCMMLSNKKIYLSTIITAFVYLFLCVWFMVSRPQIFTYPILIIELICLEKYSTEKKWLCLLPLPILSLVLINCHSSMWWMLFAFILPYIVEGVIKTISKRRVLYNQIPLYVITIIMLCIGLINPYGYKSIIYIFTSFGNKDINNSILEMGAPDVKTLNGVVFFIILSLVIFIYILNKNGKSQIRYILLSMGTIFLALMSVKSIPYFLIGTCVPLSFFLKNKADKLFFNYGSKKSLTLISVFLISIITASIYVIVSDYDALKDYPETYRAIDFLSENTEKNKVILYTSFYDGGYAEYNGFSSYIDARAEVFLKSNNKRKDIFGEYISLQKGNIHYKDFLNDYPFTHILVTDTDVLNVYLSKDDDYKIIYKDKQCKIFTPNK